MEAMLGGRDRAFTEQIRVSIVIGGLHAVIAQHPEAEQAPLRAAMLEAVAALMQPRARGAMRKRQPSEAEPGRMERSRT
jgi:hypothetical protein